MKLRMVFSSLFALVPIFFFAQVAAPPKDPLATALATRSLTAMGSSATDCTLQGNVAFSSSSLTMPVVLKNSGTSKARVELSTPKGMSVVLVNGGAGELIQPSGKAVRLSGNNTVFRRVPHLPGFSILSEHDSQTTKLEYLPATAAGPEGIALSLESDSADADEMAKMTRTVFTFDPLTGFVTQINYTRFAENDSNAKTAIEVHFSNYQAVNGVQVPFTQVTMADGKLESTLQLSSADCQTPIDSSEFTLPN